LISIKLDSN